MRKIPFDILPLGARFRYEDPSSNVWVKIDLNTIAEWDASQMDTNWVGQRVRCFTTGDDLSREVLVDDSANN
jgi:hypothetical protein